MAMYRASGNAQSESSYTIPVVMYSNGGEWDDYKYTGITLNVVQGKKLKIGFFISPAGLSGCKLRLLSNTGGLVCNDLNTFNSSNPQTITIPSGVTSISLNAGFPNSYTGNARPVYFGGIEWVD